MTNVEDEGSEKGQAGDPLGTLVKTCGKLYKTVGRGLPASTSFNIDDRVNKWGRTERVKVAQLITPWTFCVTFCSGVEQMSQLFRKMERLRKLGLVTSLINRKLFSEVPNADSLDALERKY